MYALILNQKGHLRIYYLPNMVILSNCIPPQFIFHIFNPHPVTKNGTLKPKRVRRPNQRGRPLERRRRNGKNFLFSETMLSKVETETSSDEFKVCSFST